MLDKHNLLSVLPQRPRNIMELGCGSRKRHKEWIGVDAIDAPEVDIVGDVHEVLDATPDNSLDEVHAFHFFEHVDDTARLMAQLERVMRGGGLLHVVVPHFSNPYYYSDPTHRSFWGLYTFSYLAQDRRFKRRVPQYVRTGSFELFGVRLNFKSSRPFYFRHAIKQIYTWFFNISVFTQEIYEESFCYLIPCYEVEFNLRRVPAEAAEAPDSASGGA